MAIINIKGRHEPIFISNDRAVKIKENWCGETPVPRSQILDLGEWAGEYGQIKSIELDKSDVVKAKNTKWVKTERGVRPEPLDYKLQEGEALA